jgi:hypothetical protein
MQYNKCMIFQHEFAETAPVKSGLRVEAPVFIPGDGLPKVPATYDQQNRAGFSRTDDDFTRNRHGQAGLLHRDVNQDGANYIYSLMDDIALAQAINANIDVPIPASSEASSKVSSHCMSTARQVALRKRLDASIKVTLDADSRGHDPARLHLMSQAFFAIASRLPDMDQDDLGINLRSSFKVKDGRSVHPSESTEAKSIDSLLQELSLSDLAADAAQFYMAVGELQE